MHAMSLKLQPEYVQTSRQKHRTLKQECHGWLWNYVNVYGNFAELSVIWNLAFNLTPYFLITQVNDIFGGNELIDISMLITGDKQICSSDAIKKKEA